MTEKDAETSAMRGDRDVLTDDAYQVARVKSPVETAIDAEASPSAPSNTQEKAADVLEPPPNGGLLAWMQVLG